jgi:predicted DNA-binding protein with PD1-like motif
MRSRLLSEHSGVRSFVVVLERGDHVMACMAEFAAEHRCAAAEFTAIGAFEWCRFAHFDPETRDYIEHELENQSELLSLNGRITLPRDTDPDAPEADEVQPHLHVHCVISRPDGTAVGGHLVEAEVRPTCEIFVTDHPVRLTRREDPDSGLAVIALDEDG